MAEARGRQLDDAVAASNKLVAKQCERIKALEDELYSLRRALEQGHRCGRLTCRARADRCSASTKRKPDDTGDGDRDRKALRLQQPTPPQESAAPRASASGPVLEAPTAWPRRNLVPGGHSLAHFLTSGGLNLQNL